MERLIGAFNRAANSDALINTLLVGVFATLCGRSLLQERTIKALEAEKDSLRKTNKGIKNTIWEWKQKLYAEAEANPQETLVSLATLKTIYGEVVVPKPSVESGGDDKKEGTPPARKVVVF